MSNKLKVLITGSTGMVGEGVLHVALNHPDVEKVIILNRKSLGISHPKLNEIIHTDLYDLSKIEDQLTGLNACFFCLGVSSIGMKPEEYYKISYTLTLSMAATLSKLNKEMSFSYVSGQGTVSSEVGGKHWSKVKGKTEYDLTKLPFKNVFAYRPGFMKPIVGLKNAHAYYKYINWIYPIGKWVYPNGFNTLEELGLSMIEVSLNGFDASILNGKEISITAKK